MKQSTHIVLLSFLLGIQVQAKDLPQGTAGIHFKENKGQISDQNYQPRPDILFSGGDSRFNFYLKSNGVSYQLNRVDEWITETPNYLPPGKRQERTVAGKTTVYRVDVQWLNTSPAAQVARGDAFPGYENYYSEVCPLGALFVKEYASVEYRNLYAGINLEWTSKDGALKYNYHLAPYADYKQIQLEYKGADKLYINKNGELVISTPLGDLVEQKPLVLQNGKHLKASWKIDNTTVWFEIPDRDPSQALTIDPMIRLWGTYYGGPGSDYPYVVNTDNLGNVFLCGSTESNSNIATTGAHQAVYAGGGPSYGDAFLSKFDGQGIRQWSTYYGGAQPDFGNWVAINTSGDIYMVGGTSSTNSAVMATSGAHQSTAPINTITTGSFPINDAYLVKFNSSGVRQWGTYYGGSGYEWAYCVSLDPAGDVLISGTSNSTDPGVMSTTGCYQPVYGGGVTDGFLARFTSAGLRLWGTYYGGANTTNVQDDVSWCSFAPNGDIYVAGSSPSPTVMASPGAFQTTYGGGQVDAFVAKFDGNGQQRYWGTYYGGIAYDYFTYSAVDAAGDIYLTGASSSSMNSALLTTAGAHQTTNIGSGGSFDGLLVKFNSAGTRQWATLYGGMGNDYLNNSSIDPFGNIYIAGLTSHVTGTAIATPCAYKDVFQGGSTDAFLAKFTPAGVRMWGSYFGSIYTDEGYTCAADIHANVYLCGITLASSGTVMATTGAHQPAFGGGMHDGFLQKFNGCVPALASNTTPTVNLRVCMGGTTTLNSSCGNWYNDTLSTTILSTGSNFTTGILTSDTTFFVEETVCGMNLGRTPVHVTVMPQAGTSIANTNTTACVGESITLTPMGFSSYTWSAPANGSSTWSVIVLLGDTYSVTGIDTAGCQNSAHTTIIPNLCSGIAEQQRSSGFVVYPNPNSGSFTLRAAKELQLQLFDQLGRKVRDLSLNAENNYDTTVKDLTQGVYFLKESKNGTSAQKIIVLH